MGMDLNDIDALKDKYQFLRLDGESSDCEHWDKDYLCYLRNIFLKPVKEAENDKDLCCKELSDKCLNGNDHFVNSVGKSENEDDDGHRYNILDKSVKESGNDKDLCCKDLSDEDLIGRDHVDNSVGTSENEDDDSLDNSVKESESDKDLSDEYLISRDHVDNLVGISENEDDDILDKSVKESENDKSEDLNGHNLFVNSGGKSEFENSDDDDPQYKFFLSHVKCHGKSFTFEVKEENGLSKIIEYQKEEPIDGRHDLEIHRNRDNAVGKKRKRSRSEPQNSKSVKRSSVRSFSLKKGGSPSLKHTSKKQNVSRFQPQSNKDSLGNKSEEQQEKSLSAVRHIIKREQDPLVEDDYQHFLNSAEIVSGRINLQLKSNKKIVYDEQVDLVNVLCHEVKSMSPRSSGIINNVEEDDSCQILDVDHQMDQLKEKVMAVLRKPYDEKEYNTLWHLITKKNRNERHKELRHGREKSFTTEIKAKSYLEQHKDLRREIEAVPDDKWKILNLLRGFFFWLQHLAWGPFKPWKDVACLAVRPESH